MSDRDAALVLATELASIFTSAARLAEGVGGQFVIDPEKLAVSLRAALNEARNEGRTMGRREGRKIGRATGMREAAGINQDLARKYHGVGQEAWATVLCDGAAAILSAIGEPTEGQHQ